VALTLLQHLRSRGLTGTKEGCAEGECGACAVVLVRPNGEGRACYVAVNSCLVPWSSVADQEILTVEDLAPNGQLHPVQQAMVQFAGSQCGYCTPGFVMSMFAEYYREGRRAFDPESISGNLCRCTGYRPIRDAMASLGAPASTDPFLQRLGKPALARKTLENKDFVRPQSLVEVFEVQRARPTAKLISGGTDLVVEMNQRNTKFEGLISLENVQDLRAFEDRDDAVEIGAALTLNEIEERLQGSLPIMEELFRLFSSRLIRNRATLGGNVMNASPIGDGPSVLLALGARARIVASSGERIVPLDEVFVDYRKTSLALGEVLRSILIPKPFPSIARFYKVSKRVLDDISTVAMAVTVWLDGDRVSNARIAYGGVAKTPVRAPAAEKALVGQAWSAHSLQAAKKTVAGVFKPIDDHRGSAAYRQAMAVNLLEQFSIDSFGEQS